MSVPADPVLVELLERATAEALSASARESGVFWSLVAQAAVVVPVDEVLAVAVTFCGSDESALRATGAGLLAQLCDLGNGLAGEALGALEPLLAREDDLGVIRIALHGVAATRLPDGLVSALRFASHLDPGVRLDATHALYSCAGEPAAQRAIDALIVLSADPDDDVRDWATFGLGTDIDGDGPDVRDALAARLDDPHLDVREEAAVGLARRGDTRAFETVHALLTEDEVSALTVEAAGHLDDDRLLRPLLELGEWWESDSDVLSAAIARCDPVERTRFEERTRVLVGLIEDGFAEQAPRSRLDRVSIERATQDLTTTLTVAWTNEGGLHRDAIWSIERVFDRRDVQDDPQRAAAAVLAQLEAL
jgi:HEAT repeat protein